MARLILFLVCLLVLYTVLRFLMKDVFVQRKKMDRRLEPEELVQDPCCQTYIPTETAVRKRIEGKVHYFCSRECLKKFLDGRKS